MEIAYLDPTHVLIHHLLVRLLPSRISKMALCEQQARSFQEHAYQVPRRRKSRQRVGQASIERIRGIVGIGRCRQEMVGLQSAVQEQSNLLPSFLQLLHHDLRSMGW